MFFSSYFIELRSSNVSVFVRESANNLPPLSRTNRDPECGQWSPFSAVKRLIDVTSEKRVTVANWRANRVGGSRSQIALIQTIGEDRL